MVSKYITISLQRSGGSDEIAIMKVVIIKIDDRSKR